jgi:hypothetical protein
MDNSETILHRIGDNTEQLAHKVRELLAMNKKVIIIVSGMSNADSMKMVKGAGLEIGDKLAVMSSATYSLINPPDVN